MAPRARSAIGLSAGRTGGRSWMRLTISDTSEGSWAYLEPETRDEIAALERGVVQGDWPIGRGDQSITRLRALAEQLGYRTTEVHETDASRRQVIVQQGETPLAERLRSLTPPSVPVILDRRVHDRRTANESRLTDRRRQNRRRTPSVMWGPLLFVVIAGQGDGS
jgi:hypothetical protein